MGGGAPACKRGRVPSPPSWVPGSRRVGWHQAGGSGCRCDHFGRGRHGLGCPLYEQCSGRCPGDRLPRGGAGRSPRCGRQLRLFQCRRWRKGSPDGPLHAVRSRGGAGRGGGAGGAGLHRRDRDRAAAREGRGRRAGRMRRPWRRRRELLQRNPHERRRPQARLPGGDAPVGHRAAGGAGQGGRDDLAAPRHDVLLHPDGRRARGAHPRPAHRGVRAALLRPHQRRRAALDQRHGGGPGERRLRGTGRAGVGRRAGARRGARRSAAPASARDRARRRGCEARGPGGRERPAGRRGARGARRSPTRRS